MSISNMATFSNSLVIRSLRTLDQNLTRPYANDEPPPVEVPAWLFPTLALTGLVCVLTLGSISYTYGLLVPTLAMVEEPSSTCIVQTSPVDGQHPDDPLLGPDEKHPPLPPLEQELFLIKPKPVTAKLRTAVRHLRQRAGRTARFRGLHVYLILLLGQTLFSELLASLLPDTLLTRSVVYVGSAVAFSRLSMAWTHRVISEPRPDKRWWQRLADRSAARRIVLPTFKFALADMVANLLPLLALRASGLVHTFSGITSEEGRRELAGGPYPVLAALVIFFVAMAGQLFVYLPASVMLVRTQASLLPDEDEPIVPFDRTFGGKVVPAVAGGSGRLEMRDAWRSFDWNARVRLVKIFIKAQVLQIFTVMAFEVLAFFQLYLAFGPQISWFLRHATNASPDSSDAPPALASYPDDLELSS